MTFSPEIPLTHTICKNSIPGEMGMNIDKDHVRRRIRQTLKDKEIDRPGNLTRDTCQIWENLHNVGRTMEPKSVQILIPYFGLLVFGFLVTLVAWFSFHFFTSWPSCLSKCDQKWNTNYEMNETLFEFLKRHFLFCTGYF